jgi:DNA-binding NarL/FixJ family response regulator
MPATSEPRPALRPATTPCEVVVVDRSRLDRDLLALAVARAEGFALVASVGCLATVAETVPPAQAVVIRASSPATDLLAEVGAAAGLPGRPRVVVLAGYVDDYLVGSLADAGADAVVSFDLSLAEVLGVVRGATVDGAVAPADVVTAVTAVFDRRELGHRHHLTRREQEILDHLADGLAPGEIAHLLQIRLSTIRDHVKSLRAKLGCTSATQVVVVAHRLGLVPHVGRPLR